MTVCVGVSDLNEAIPETELLDNSIQKGRAQLSVKARRHRPSRSRYRDSISSTEGDDCLDRKVEVSQMVVITVYVSLMEPQASFSMLRKTEKDTKIQISSSQLKLEC